MSTAVEDEDGALDSTATELFYNSADDLWLTSRLPTSPWSIPLLQTALSSTSIDETPRLSSDDLTIFFASDRNGPSEIFRSTRSAIGQPWSAPVAIPEVSNFGAWPSMHWLSPCDDGHYITARYEATTDYDLYEGIKDAGAPSPITALNTATFDSSPYVTPDCTTLYFASDGAGGSMDIYVTTRASSADAWGPASRVDEASFAGSSEQDPSLSQDGTMFIFTSDKQGASKDIYFMTRTPL